MDDAACRRLIAAMLLQAARDVQRGQPCNGACRGGAHVCADDARAWLIGEGAALADALDIHPDDVRAWAALARGG